VVAAALVSAHASASAQGSDIELGATEASDAELGISSGKRNQRPAAYSGSSYSSESSVRLGVQLRLDAMNTLGLADSSPGSGPSIGRRLFVPFLAPGARFASDRLFLGVGLGFYGYNIEEPDGDEISRSGWGIGPVAGYDIVREGAAALSLNAALNLAHIGETEICTDPGCVDANDDATGIGLTLGAGIRGLLLPGLALGADFGWGLLSVSADNDESLLVHGLYGALLLEASVGL
jgi:hypothetical protein